MAAKAPNIDPAKTWIISDSHWGHQNIIGFCRRPHDHEQIMMEEWAQAVPELGATVLHLGDLTWKNNGVFKHVISKHLTGERKLLIKGNHDHCRPQLYKAAGFKIVAPFEIKYDDWTVSFSHYPLKEPAKKKHLHIHGHLHNQGYNGKHAPYSPFAYGQINVSAEQIHYRPVNLDELLKGAIYGCYDEDLYNMRKEKKSN